MLAVQAVPQIRKRVYHAKWEYRLGQAVAFGETGAIVLARERTLLGRQLYSLWIMGDCAGRPFRNIVN